MEQLPLLVALAVAGVVGVIGLLRSYQRSERRRALPAAARSAGLEYSPDDQFKCTAVAFPLFRAGDGRQVQDVMWRPDTGTDHPAPVRVFDYSYYDEYRDKNGHVRKQWSYFTCALVQHHGSWPQLSVKPEGVLDKAEQFLGGDDIQFESEEFNRTFAVHCEDRRFASALIDPQMMEILLKTGGTISLDTMGRFLLLSSDPLDPPVLPRLLAMAEDVLAHVPPAVWELYPTVPDQVAPESASAGSNGFDRPPQAWMPFDETPSLLHPDDSWDPTPGVDHDLEGRVIEAPLEDPWRDQPNV